MERIDTKPKNGLKNTSKVFLNDAVEAALRDENSDEMVSALESRVLILYTGGTIGMKNTPEHGYIPVLGYLTKTLANMNRFNTEEPSIEDSVNVPLEYRLPSLEPVTPDAMALHIGTRFDDASSAKVINGTAVATTRLPSLLTPPSLYGKRIRYSVLEYDPLLDSANMTMTHWIKIATDIEVNYELFDAFIILHGTDTMAYTASALSFMLENLGKTVIITGSQVPISEVRNDAVDNLLGALTIAGHFVLPEVGLYFDHHLFRGNRSTKIDAVRFDAFDSPNLRPLVSVNIHIDVSWTDVFRPTAIACFRAHKAMNPNVATLRLFPGITESTVKAFLQPPIQGVVLETYGAGNAPNNRPEILEAFKKASERGVVIVNCTQCRRGLVSAAYATGKALLAVGVIPGSDMTPECALTKLSYLLSKGCSPTEVSKLMTANLRGELTLQSSRQRFTYLQYTQGLLQTIESFVRTSSASLNDRDASAAQPDARCSETGLPRFDDGEIQALQKLLVPIMLCQAAKGNDLESLQNLLRQFPPLINMADYSGRTALHVASCEGQLEAVKLLLQKGAMVHIRDRLGHSPLYDALINKHLPVVAQLRKTGAHFSYEEQDLVKEHFFSAVCGSGNIAAMHCYVIAGVELGKPFGVESSSAFHTLAASGKANELYYLYAALCFSLAALDAGCVDSASPNLDLKCLNLPPPVLELIVPFHHLFAGADNFMFSAPGKPVSMTRQLSGISLNSIDLSNAHLSPLPAEYASLDRTTVSASSAWQEQLQRVKALLHFNLEHRDAYGREPRDIAAVFENLQFSKALEVGKDILSSLERLVV